MLDLQLKSGKEKIIAQGHPWIFSGALKELPEASPGTLAAVCSENGEPLALAFYHPHSDISLRILTHNTQINCDSHFWRERLNRACALRKMIIPSNTNAFRLINAEGDGFPGLIVDQYDQTLVLSISTAGMEQVRDLLIQLFMEIIHPKAIYERSEGKARQHEGLQDRIGWILQSEACEHPMITENGYCFTVDLINGQKTGFFLDQRDNRALIGSYSNHQNILNCFSYSGGFSVYCVCQGALKVTSVDSSEQANDLTLQNFKLNGISAEKHPIMTANAFHVLRETEECFDLIILDPPAFAKSRHDINQAARGYKDIHLHAFKKIRPGGLLATFSCSNFIDENLFTKIVLGAARDAGKIIQLLKILGPGPDHPTLLSHPEGRYLKGLLLRVFHD